jgi:hypothetical protein
MLNVTFLMANSIAQSSRLAAEQAAASAAAASSASLAAASASAEAEAAAQAEKARQDLIAACDLQVLDQVSQDEEVLFAWTQCEDTEVALRAAVALVELGTPRKVSLAGREIRLMMAETDAAFASFKWAVYRDSDRMFVSDDDVRFMDGMATAVPDGAEVYAHAGMVRYAKEKGITVPKRFIPPEYKGN